jgi:hypothetical protein
LRHGSSGSSGWSSVHGNFVAGPYPPARLTWACTNPSPRDKNHCKQSVRVDFRTSGGNFDFIEAATEGLVIISVKALPTKESHRYCPFLIRGRSFNTKTVVPSVSSQTSAQKKIFFGVICQGTQLVDGQCRLSKLEPTVGAMQSFQLTCIIHFCCYYVHRVLSRRR